jgi:hypothetical protein
MLSKFRLYALDKLPGVGDRYSNLATSLMSGGVAQGAQAGGIYGNLLAYANQNRMSQNARFDQYMQQLATMAGGL